MLTPLRRFYGLRWKSERPTLAELGIDAHGILFAIVIVLAFGLVDIIDRWQEARVAEGAALERIAQQQAAMLACLNGGSPGYYSMTADGHRAYLVCDVYTVTDQHTRRDM